MSNFIPFVTQDEEPTMVHPCFWLQVVLETIQNQPRNPWSRLIFWQPCCPCHQQVDQGAGFQEKGWHPSFFPCVKGEVIWQNSNQASQNCQTIQAEQDKQNQVHCT